jgi:hypothetical protein
MVCVETLFLGTHTMNIQFGFKTECDIVASELCQLWGC